MATKPIQRVVIYPKEEDVAVNLQPHVAVLSDKAIAEKGYFTVVLSGGTLVHTLRKLTQSPLKETMNWSKWLIFWVDERVVPLDNPESNYHLALKGFLSKEFGGPLFNELWHPTVMPSMSIFAWRLLNNFIPVDARLKEKGMVIVSKCCCCENIETIEHLFLNSSSVKEVPGVLIRDSRGKLIMAYYDFLGDQTNTFAELYGFLEVPIPKNNIYPIHYSPSAEAVAKDYEARLRKLVEDKVLPLSPTGFPQFDLMLLGLGPDGHVASLFPNRTQPNNLYDWVTYINDSPKPPPKRITFTFPVINSAKHIAMVVTGAEEAKAVVITLENLQVRPRLPCYWLKPQVSLTWFLDWDAASKLPHNFYQK
ncbi:UNVERIFIED_CONTAM: putative 6-phosphogluconolactonase 4, chloroplastic [Sesamum radiatum]|uniref:6-phosphogluconolactonase 4, chloroplastic n=1 Tax=Sesamum radiatum TaxID=300843 RepID=A0AAW2KE57_SESRA